MTEFENYFVFDREAPELLKPYHTTKSVTPELTAKKKDHDQSASQSGTPNYEALEDIQAGIENLTRAFKTERLQRNNDTVEHQMSAHTEIISSQITSLKAEINNSIRHKEVSRQVIPIIRYQWITLVLQILTLVLLLILLVLNFYSFAERS
ncbi:MAG TPA: hypothetical protein DIU20_06005 [Cryomorphaceae bacterium]|nr:hypothetical protein [Cryomorphaceae bacterium]